MQDARKREMLVLVHKHLQDEGLIDAASVLGNQHIVRSAGEFHVCRYDNTFIIHLCLRDFLFYFSSQPSFLDEFK